MSLWPQGAKIYTEEGHERGFDLPVAAALLQIIDGIRDPETKGECVDDDVTAETKDGLRGFGRVVDP